MPFGGGLFGGGLFGGMDSMFENMRREMVSLRVYLLITGTAALDWRVWCVQREGHDLQGY